MNELSHDERRCLAMWFRQAIAKLELAEVTQVMLKEFPPASSESTLEAPSHKAAVARRRASRSRLKSHIKELVI